MTRVDFLEIDLHFSDPETLAQLYSMKDIQIGLQYLHHIWEQLHKGGKGKWF